MEKTYPREKVHLLYLDSLRGIAAVLVVIHHALLQVRFDGYSLSAAQSVFLAAFQNGHYPVDFFIVLSGYCLMIPVVKGSYVLRGGALSFFRRRARRILPPYYLAMLLSLGLIATIIGQKTGTHWDTSIPVTKADILVHLLLIQDVLISTGGKINHAFWSISVEWRIYFLFPVLVWLWRKAGPVRTLALVVATVAVLIVVLRYLHQLNPDVNNNPNGIVPHYILLFTLGMLGADITLGTRNWFAKWGNTQWAIGLASITVLIIGLSKASETITAIPWQLIDVCVGTWGICLLVLCHRLQHAPAGQYDALKALMGWQPLVFIGTFGYSLYLIHAPLLQVVSQYMLMPLGLNPFVEFIALSTGGLFLIVLAAYGFFLLCERPFMTKRLPAPVAAIAEPAI